MSHRYEVRVGLLGVVFTDDEGEALAAFDKLAETRLAVDVSLYDWHQPANSTLWKLHSRSTPHDLDQPEELDPEDWPGVSRWAAQRREREAALKAKD
jgi:hypothetical protein